VGKKLKGCRSPTPHYIPIIADAYVDKEFWHRHGEDYFLPHDPKRLGSWETRHNLEAINLLNPGRARFNDQLS